MTTQQQTINISVQRALCYASKLNAGSYNYKYDQQPPVFLKESDVWDRLSVQCYGDAREKFFLYINKGIEPDYSEDIYWIKKWLNENDGKPGWEGAINTKKIGLSFLEGGYKSYNVDPVLVVYNVTTLPPYSLGTSPQINGKWMPDDMGDDFQHTEMYYTM